MCATTLQSSAVESTKFPGLPDAGDTLLAPRVTGLTEARTARQWVRIPSAQAVGFPGNAVERRDPTCLRLGKYSYTADYSAQIFMLSPVGSAAKYGYIGPFTTRTVAFGSIPVEASIRISQQRDADNLPVPLRAKQKAAQFCPGLGPNAGHGQIEQSLVDTEVTGSVDIDITSISVDGVSLRLKQTCRSKQPVALKLTAPDVFSLDPTLGVNNPLIPPGADLDQDADRDLVAKAILERTMTSPYFNFGFGGLLTATVDIPPFAGCTTASGEDISPLLTSAISGPTNDLKLRSEALTAEVTTDGGCWATDSCTRLPEIPIP